MTQKKKPEKNYARKIDEYLTEWEYGRPWKQWTTDMISDYIGWCWKFRKITEEEKNDFCDRITAIYDFERWDNSLSLPFPESARYILAIREANLD